MSNLGTITAKIIKVAKDWLKSKNISSDSPNQGQVQDISQKVLQAYSAVAILKNAKTTTEEDAAVWQASNALYHLRDALTDAMLDDDDLTSIQEAELQNEVLKVIARDIPDPVQEAPPQYTW
jgi:hypothetical protein